MSKLALAGAMVWFALAGVPAHAAAPVTFATRTAFDASVGPVFVEDFSHTTPGFYTMCTSPLSDTKLDQCFYSLLHGPTYDVGPGSICHQVDPNGGCLIPLYVGLWGNDSSGLFTEYFGDTFQVQFESPGVEAVGFNVVDVDLCGSLDEVTISAYGKDGLIVRETVVADTGGTRFWGIASERPITSIILAGIGPCWVPGSPGVSKLAFGTPTKTLANSIVLGGGTLDYTSTTTSKLGGNAVTGGTVDYWSFGGRGAGAPFECSAAVDRGCGGPVSAPAGTALNGDSYTAEYEGPYPWLGSSGTGTL